MRNDNYSSKRTRLTFLITIIVVFLLFFLFLFIKFRKEEIPQESNPFGEFNVAYEQTPLIGCFIGIDGYKNFCFKSQNKGFYTADFMIEHPEVEKLSPGFYILELNDNILTEHKVETGILFDKWYKDIVLNEKKFLKQAGERTAVDLYNLGQLRMIQIEKGKYTNDNLIEELTLYSGDDYVITSPLRYSDFSYLCSIAPKMCASFSYSYRIPYTQFRKINDNSDFDFKDLELIWSSLKMLNLGVNSLNKDSGNNEQILMEYEEFLSKVLANNPDLTREQLLFVGEYLPLWLIEYIDILYENWVGDLNDYYLVLLDAVCGKSECSEIKLNVLYNEYKK